MTPVPEIDATALAAELDGADAPFLLDVREAGEYALCAIPGATLIPLGQVTQRANELPAGRRIVAYCHHGRRSAQAAQYLIAQGYDVRNLAGGIDAWAVAVDPDMVRY